MIDRVGMTEDQYRQALAEWVSTEAGLRQYAVEQLERILSEKDWPSIAHDLTRQLHSLLSQWPNKVRILGQDVTITPAAADRDDLARWVQFELECLWSDLRQMHRHRECNRNIWPVGCEHIAGRIKEATALVGPISWRRVGMSAIADGWFTWACTKLGIENPDLPTEDDLAECRRWVESQMGDVSYGPY